MVLFIKRLTLKNCVGVWSDLIDSDQMSSDADSNVAESWLVHWSERPALFKQARRTKRKNKNTEISQVN